ncbi:MAG: UDP-N-acetylmuramoyl-L-alanine--D-glutamate ligase [Spirochaetaceae bacterium]|nr:UDP-N-acetylmuramoyl-L-alanine--D-glutamate ligase [Spirochaetaceae bacterium]
MRVTIMGLGLNGGGMESARYLALRGAECTVTDMKDEKTLLPSIEKLEALEGPHRPFRYVLGRHEMDDFSRADMVIKNPGVPPHSPYLAAARRIETDISLFLAASPARLTAVTGSKGKSTATSAIHWVLQKAREASLFPGRAFLGGNITVSPLLFLDGLTAADDVVLELSSWQLGDLRGRTRAGGTGALLKPRVAVLTAIMADHQDRYGGMEAYVQDKRVIYQGQDKVDLTVASGGDPWGRSFLAESPGRTLPYFGHELSPGTAGGWIEPDSGAGMVRLPGESPVEAVPALLAVPGEHQKKNLLAAALALLDLGLPAPLVRNALGTFPGIEHRLEFFHQWKGIRFYNDTAATIPEAAAAAVEAFAGTKLILVSGGTDKNLDFSPLVRAAAKAQTVVLLAGTGSDKIALLLTQAGIPFQGPWDTVDAAAAAALTAAVHATGTAGAMGTASAEPAAGTTPAETAAGKVVTVVLSPGCASFGMFKNEFDRGRRWKEAVIEAAARASHGY